MRKIILPVLLALPFALAACGGGEATVKLEAASKKPTGVCLSTSLAPSNLCGEDAKQWCLDNRAKLTQGILDQLEAKNADMIDEIGKAGKACQLVGAWKSGDGSVQRRTTSSRTAAP